MFRAAYGIYFNMKNIILFIITSLVLHGFLFFSFHFIGGKTKSKEHLGQDKTTQFEVRQKRISSKKAIQKNRIPKLQKNTEPTTGIQKIEKENINTTAPGSSEKPVTESLASVKGLIGISRPLTQEEKYKVYLYRKIYSSIDYPEIAQKLNQEGLVVMSINIKSSGDFKTNIVKECPFKRLNQAAKRTFESLGPFKSFPKEVTRKEFNFTVPVNYQIEE